MRRPDWVFVIVLLFCGGISTAEPRMGEETRGRVIGIGGVFFKSENQKELYVWYEKHLGFKRVPREGMRFHWRLAGEGGAAHSTTWAIFPKTTKYFDPGRSDLMLNYIVDDLDAILKRLEAEGVRIDPKRETDEAGRFAWIFDSDGNKVELWEPAKEPQR